MVSRDTLASERQRRTTVDDTETGPKNFAARVEDGLRADVGADQALARELVAELIEKVEGLEKRIAHLEHRA